MNVSIERFYKYFSNRNIRLLSISSFVLFSSFIMYKIIRSIKSRRKVYSKVEIKDLIKQEIIEKENKLKKFEIKKEDGDDNTNVIINILKAYNYRITDNIIAHYKEAISKSKLNKENINQNDSIRDFREFSWLENTSINYHSLLDLNLSSSNMSKSQMEFYYYLYMKIGNIIHKDIFDNFQEKRLEIYRQYSKENKQDKLVAYIEYCLKVKNDLREKENELHSIILETMQEIEYCKKEKNDENNIKSKNTNNKFMYDVNLEKIKRFYYEESKEPFITSKFRFFKNI